ncbi:MAG TPA: DUF2461 domain-containing protein [Prolixibacteraceae bacterium]|nr:DUF2461 domain-containing protein [Prolixibacteraceae bacterium]HPT31894.1 DUF2461 domain-containing protein [Prolixibacteraceae bacterium]
MKEILQFLAELETNNNREWFNAHKKRYEAAREKMLFITELFVNEIRKFDPDIPVMDPKDCLFRIYRDVRFSLDKSPYKTHFGSYIAKGGHKSQRAGYYFHVQPGESFLGGGIWMPPAEVLKAIRFAVYDHPEEFLSILEDPGFRKYFKEFDAEKLKTAPKGFPPDFPYIDLLKPKSYAFGTTLTEEELVNNQLFGKGLDAFRELYKLNRFLNDALDNYL